MTAGFFDVGRDEISFEPLDPAAKKYSFRVSRAGLTSSISTFPRLHVEAAGKKWIFQPAFVFTQTPTMGEVFGTGLKEARGGAAELAAKFLGDFDRALAAFDTPGILEGMPGPRVPGDTLPPGDDAPDPSP